ncbi:MAG: CehA/McbA family metallohydrolase [Kiritimatiellae bacterium]|nr:CehA/McbA family metallohydrolase [Kiritimatiellia bacterium]
MQNKRVPQLVTFDYANPFRVPGRWLKGNTHTHTVNSDGVWTADDVRRGYGRHGYDFVFLTDHWKRTVASSPARARPLLIPAEEVDFLIGRQLYHAVCLGISDEWPRRSFKSVAEFIRQARRRCDYIVMAHPYWSGTRSDGYLGVGAFDATEVYNTGVDRSIAKGYSGTYWDDYLDAGLRVHGLAADDAHGENHAYGGWIMVKATACTEKAIMAAIRKGHFYATQGPEIRDIRFDGRRMTVKCSPVHRINFICSGYFGKVCQAGSRPLTEASWELHPDVAWARIECVDREGRIAWSNPIWQRWDTRRIEAMKRRTLRSVTAPRLRGANAAMGDPERVDWTAARTLSPWMGLMGESTRRKLEVRLAHDGRYLYLQLEEMLDPRSLVVNRRTVWLDDEWEVFFSRERGQPCRQMGVNATGAMLTVDHSGTAATWDNGAKAVSETRLRDRWRVRLALPLARLVPGGAQPGDTVYANFIRSTEGGSALAWVPTFKSHYHEPSRLGAVRLE